MKKLWNGFSGKAGGVASRKFFCGEDCVRCDEVEVGAERKATASRAHSKSALVA